MLEGYTLTTPTFAAQGVVNEMGDDTHDIGERAAFPFPPISRPSQGHEASLLRKVKLFPLHFIESVTDVTTAGAPLLCRLPAR